MGYDESRPLSSLLPIASTRDLEEGITNVVGDRFLLNVKANTPVAHGWDTGGLSQSEITALRGGRKPGTLRESIYRLPAIKIPLGWSVTVATDDPIAPYVEWDTQPHDIYPRVASVLAWADIKVGGVMAFAMSVHHPGTHGQHMFSIGALLTELEAAEVAQPLVEAWAAGNEIPGAGLVGDTVAADSVLALV